MLFYEDVEIILDLKIVVFFGKDILVFDYSEIIIKVFNCVVDKMEYEL